MQIEPFERPHLTILFPSPFLGVGVFILAFLGIISSEAPLSINLTFWRVLEYQNRKMRGLRKMEVCSQFESALAQNLGKLQSQYHLPSLKISAYLYTSEPK